MFETFTYTTKPNTVHFGEGKLPEVLSTLMESYERGFIMASDRLSFNIERLRRRIGPEKFVHFSRVVQHVPETLVIEAKEAMSAHKLDVLIAIGGGSAIGLAKALALETSLPIIAVPTTYSGSEMTDIWGITGPEGKKTGRDTRVLPTHVIYDAAFTLGLPLPVAKTSVMNAMAHLLEAVYAVENNPVTYTLALKGIELLRDGIESLGSAKFLSPKVNEQFLTGAYLSGKCLGEVSMALHHKTAHILGGTYGLEHSQVHTALQSFAFAYQWSGLDRKQKKDFQHAFDHDFPPLKLHELIGALGAPTSLEEIGYKAAFIPATVDRILAVPYPNPVPLREDRLTKMLQYALVGSLEPF